MPELPTGTLPTPAIPIGEFRVLGFLASCPNRTRNVTDPDSAVAVWK
jgi:hypothetical protein